MPAPALRSYFNAHDIEGQLARGLLRRVVHKEYHPRQLTHEPFCTWSRSYRYETMDGKPVAVVHEYDRPDGSVGGSGHPDPKWLSVGDEVWGCE